MRKQSIRHSQTQWNKRLFGALKGTVVRCKIFPASSAAGSRVRWAPGTDIYLKLYRLYLYCIVLHCSPAFPLSGPSPVTPPGLADTQTNAPGWQNQKGKKKERKKKEIGQDLGVAKVCHRVQLNSEIAKASLASALWRTSDWHELYMWAWPRAQINAPPPSLKCH